MATWPDSDTLARVHLVSTEQAVDCQDCHTDAFPPTGPAPAETCLSCHGGSMEAVIALTEDRDPNPHLPTHMSQFSCTFCHEAHEPYRDPCQLCH